jgi:diaminobutyrate-2-oxoglutarate transaminase
MGTTTKEEFLQKFGEIILTPRKYPYKVQFTGPTGANAVEAALKLARKITGRETIVAFTGAFHGMSLGALAMSARISKRKSAGISLSGTVRMPFDGYFGEGIDTVNLIESMLFGPGSGIDLPAAFILETVQAEGGLNVATGSWLRRIAQLARDRGVLLIVDDIQAGCGRTGGFFSFEQAGIIPDLVCLSKSIGGYGLPMALLLIRRELDRWEPGEHNGTFRGHNLAFVAASKALDFWKTEDLAVSVFERSEQLRNGLRSIAALWPEAANELRGRGLLQGIAWKNAETAAAVSERAFEAGVMIELCGAQNEVTKFMPPLTIEKQVLSDGLTRVATAVEALACSISPPVRAESSEAVSALA